MRSCSCAGSCMLPALSTFRNFVVALKRFGAFERKALLHLGQRCRERHGKSLLYTRNSVAMFLRPRRSLLWNRRLSLERNARSKS